MMLGGSAWADGEWTAPALPATSFESLDGNKTYYLYNVEADAFYRRGLNWNTRSVATRLSNGDSSASTNNSASHEEYKFTVEKSTIKIMMGDKGLGDNLYVDNGSPIAFSYTEISTGSKIYRLSNNDQHLCTGWGNGGPLVFSTEKTTNKWALIVKDNITGGSYAKYKAKKELYNLYEAIIASGCSSLYTTELATAKAVYDADNSTAAQVKTATRALLLAAQYAISDQQTVKANALFTNPDMSGANSYSDWGVSPTKEFGIAEQYHVAFNLTQTQSDVPNGKYTVVAKCYSRESAQSLILTSGESTENASAPLLNAINFQDALGDLRFYSGEKPNDRYHAGQAIAHDDAKATVSNFAVANNSLTISLKQEATDSWDVFQSFDITFSGLSKAELVAEFNALKTAAATLVQKEMYAPVKQTLSAKMNVSIDGNSERINILSAINELKSAYDAANKSAYVYACNQ